MALNAKLRTELTKYVKLGSTVSYFDRNNENDKSTMTDPNNLFENAIKNGQILEILQAIYNVSSDSKFDGSPFLISKKGSKFIITDSKTASSDEIKTIIKPSLFIVSDNISKTKTTIELNKVITQAKAETKPFKTQIEDALKTAKNDADLVKLITSALNVQ